MARDVRMNDFRCTSWRGTFPHERQAGLPRNVQCENAATVFFVDKYGQTWPRCSLHVIGWIRYGEPNPSDGAREISREEYEILLVQES